MKNSTLKWHDAKLENPDSYNQLICLIDDDSDEFISIGGFYNKGEYWNLEEHKAKEKLYDVMYWAYLPKVKK